MFSKFKVDKPQANVLYKRGPRHFEVEQSVLFDPSWGVRPTHSPFARNRQWPGDGIGRKNEVNTSRLLCKFIKYLNDGAWVITKQVCRDESIVSLFFFPYGSRYRVLLLLTKHCKTEKHYNPTNSTTLLKNEWYS